MMDFLKQWTFCICVTLILAVVLSLLTPKGKMQQFYRLLIAFFVLTSFFYPLSGLSADRFDWDDFSLSVAEPADSHAVYENAVNAQIKSVLEENGIVGSSVQSRMQIDRSSGEITVQEVVIAVADEYDKKQVHQMIFDILGLNAKVIGLGE